MILVGLLLPLTIAYATALLWVWDSWWLEGGYYSHGPLVVAVSAGLLVLRRAALPTALGDGRGWFLLGPALFVHLCGVALMIDSLSALSLGLAVPGVVLLVGGAARLRAMGPQLGLLVFALPLPMRVTGDLAFRLKEIAVTAGLAVANATGCGAVREGAWIRVPDREQLLLVADPCGGLRSLLALLAIGYALAFLMGPQGSARRWILLAAAAPVALLANILRIAGICWLARVQGLPMATGWGHDLLNALAWVFDLAVLLAIDYWLVRPSKRGGVA